MTKLAPEEKRDAATEVITTWEKYRSAADAYRNNVQENREFRYGRQWTEEQIEALEARGQAPLVINRIHPAIETMKALLTANRPQVTSIPVGEGDDQLSDAISLLMHDMFERSDWTMEFRTAIDDYETGGLGFWYVYIDQFADGGKGAVKFKAVDALDVYVDPNSTDRLFRDAEHIYLSYMFTKEQAAQNFPEYAQAIMDSASTRDYNWPVTENADGGLSKLFFGADIARNMTDEDSIRAYLQFTKVRIMHYRVFETWSGEEYVYNEEEYKAFLQSPAVIYNGRPVIGEANLQRLQEELNKAATLRDQALAKIKAETESKRLVIQQELQGKISDAKLAVEHGQITEEKAAADIAVAEDQANQAIANLQAEFEQQAAQLTAPPDVQATTVPDLIKNRAIQIVSFPKSMVNEKLVLGDILVRDQNLDIDEYPVVPVVLHHTRTPYPVGDVELVKDMQRYKNKVRSLIVAHAASSTNVKVLVPTGAVQDMQEFEQKMARPGAVALEVDFDEGQPIIMQPIPLPNELYKNEADANNDIDYILGVYELMMGNGMAAPETYKATLSIDEYGQRRINSKLLDIEASLNLVGKVAFRFMQQLYTSHRIVRVLQPDGDVSKVEINAHMLDDYGNVIGKINDITTGEYDIRFSAVSMLPDQKWAKFEMYTEAYKLGIIDQEEVLKKTRIFDKRGVLERTSKVKQLQQQLQQTTEMIKNMQKELQSKDRQIQTLTNKIETTKYKAELEVAAAKAKMAGELYEKRLADATAEFKKTTREKSSNRRKRNAKS